MSRKWIYGLILSLCFTVPAFLTPAFSAEQDDLIGDMVIPDVLARVNGVPIQSKYIKFQLARILSRIKQPVDLMQKGRIVRSLIDKEVVRELVLQEGKGQNVTPDQEILEKEVKALREPYKDEDEFKKALQLRDITEEDLKKSLEVDLIARQLLEKQIKGKIMITNWSIRKYYDDNEKKFYRPETFRARHIFIPPWPLDLINTASPEELGAKKKELSAEAEKKINQILEEVKAGGDFAKLASKYSQDAGSARNGGDIGFIYKGIFDPAFDEAVSKLKPGEVSGVVQSTFGYHIIKLLETKPGGQAPFEKMKEAIQKHLFIEEAEKKVAEYTDELRDKADVEILF